MNGARPAPGAVLARLADVPDPGAIALHFARGDERYSILIARRGGEAFAYENRCSHADYPLDRDDGVVLVQEGRYLVCPHHGASYALDTGACAGGPCNGAGLRRISIQVRDGAVLIPLE